jgi:Leucine-rich repeat (LRR) protein
VSLTQATFGTKVLPPPPAPKYETRLYTEDGPKLVEPNIPVVSHTLPANSRDWRTLNSSVLLEDDPYSSEEDEPGIVTACKEVHEIDEFERRNPACRTSKPKRAAKEAKEEEKKDWTGESDVLNGFSAVSRDELLGVFKTLSLVGKRVKVIDADVMKMANLMSLDVSSNEIEALKNVPGSLLSLSAYDNSIEALDELGVLPNLMQLGLGYNGLRVLPYELCDMLPGCVSLDLSYNGLENLDEVLATLGRTSAHTIRHLYVRRSGGRGGRVRARSGGALGAARERALGELWGQRAGELWVPRASELLGAACERALRGRVRRVLRPLLPARFRVIRTATPRASDRGRSKPLAADRRRPSAAEAGNGEGASPGDRKRGGCRGETSVAHAPSSPPRPAPLRSPTSCTNCAFFLASLAGTCRATRARWCPCTGSG